MLGPVWLLVGPSLFIFFLGQLYAHIGGVTLSDFLPHLTIGLVTWTLISGFVIGSTTVFQRARAQILQGGFSLRDIVLVDVFSTILQFSHQVVLILAVFLVFQLSVTWYAATSLVGLALLIANGIWLTELFGVIGARYRDLSEVMQAIMRIAFLATPILWMPGGSGRGGVMGAFLVYNPFYHFLDLVRAPLMGSPIDPLSWIIVICITLFGFLLSWLVRSRLAHNVALWV